MIKTRSTYLLTYDLEIGADVRLDIYIWQGLKAVMPANPEYVITDKNQANLATAIINISNLLNDFIEFNPVKSLTTQLIDDTNSLNIVIERTVVGGATTEILREIGIKGFYSAIEGINVGVNANILLSNDYYKVNRSGFACIPIVATNSNLTIISTPNNEINQTIAVTESTSTDGTFKVLFVNVSDAITDTEIEISYQGETAILEIFEEHKYSPVDIVFVNKNGMQEMVTFFKERKDSMNVEGEMYQRTGVNVSQGQHNFIDFNIDGKSKFSVNSGFIEFEQNETMKQLLLSEYVWQLKNDKFIPLNLESKSIEYKNINNDKLIRYTLNFKYSFTEINML